MSGALTAEYTMIVTCPPRTEQTPAVGPLAGEPSCSLRGYIFGLQGGMRRLALGMRALKRASVQTGRLRFGQGGGG